MPLTPFDKMLVRGDLHLAGACPHMRSLVRRAGPCGLQLQSDGFAMLVRSVTSQQISGTAARAIRQRLEKLVSPAPIDAASVRKCGEGGLREVGYSARKASYLLSLSTAVLENGLDLAALVELDDSAVVGRLTEIRGIGVWTAKMFLIFSLGRPDVLPHEDLGIRQAIRNFHSLKALPGRDEAIELARPWRPFASVASWYCWRSLDSRLGTEAT